MPKLTLVEAAMRTGWSIPLLQACTGRGLKRGETWEKFASTGKGADRLVDADDLDRYKDRLAEPWPPGKDGGRPRIPDPVKADVRDESFRECAVCADKRTEVAHLVAVSKTLNNSPDNLLLLCPNHHTTYDDNDEGCRRSEDLSLETALAYKTVKRATRRRMLQREHNAVLVLSAVIGRIESLQASLALAGDQGGALAKAVAAELDRLLRELPKAYSNAEQAAEHDKSYDASTAFTPTAKFRDAAAAAARPQARQGAARKAAVQRLIAARPSLRLKVDPDCPHCDGSGQVGLVDSPCPYCHGRATVTADALAAYDPTAIDQHPCPRCNGRGLTGLVGDYCAYCRGACVVTRAKADAYDPADIDEVDCPRCDGRGQTGLAGDPCSYCRGSCLVPRDKAAAYDPALLDETDCPRCHGRGQLGLVGDLCDYCQGSQTVTAEKAERFDETEIRRVGCPACAGRGLAPGGDFCLLCRGGSFVDRDDADGYDGPRAEEPDW